MIFSYAFVENQTEHEHEGGRILRLSGFDRADAVFDHGNPDIESWTDELLILNLADMTTGPNGKSLTMDQRLVDIKNRYSPESTQLIKANRLANRIHTELNNRNLKIPNL